MSPYHAASLLAAIPLDTTHALAAGSSPLPLITYMLLALAISHLCSILEATLLSTPTSYITTLSQQNTRGWQLLKRLKTDIDRPISAILIINTIANTVGAALVGSQAARLYNNTGIAIVSALFTLLILIISEIIPKTIGSTHWRTLAIPASRIINFLIIITYPLTRLLQLITHLIASNTPTASVSREDVAAIVSTSAQEGAIEKEENKMIQSLLKLDDITAHQIMTPSSVVAMAESSLTIRQFYNDPNLKQFSRIPIYEAQNDDYITGYILKQEALERMAEDKFNTPLKALARPILAFDEHTSVATIWEKLLQSKEHISAIVDEYGSARGIVTMEDVIETMLGYEIVDEKDKVVDMQELAKQQWKQVQQQHNTIQKHDDDERQDNAEQHDND